MSDAKSRVAGKKVFISGGAGGLGSAMARMLAREGAKVSLADINFDGAKAVADEINASVGKGTAFAFPLDVTKEDQWIYALEEADAAMGGISVLVNNAGISRGGNIEQLSFDDWKLVMSVNLDSVFLGTKHALKYLRPREQVFNMRYEQPSTGGPVIVNGTAYSDQEALGNALKDQYKVRSVKDITSCNTCHR